MTRINPRTCLKVHCVQMLTKKVQKEVSQKANLNLSCMILMFKNLQKKKASKNIPISYPIPPPQKKCISAKFRSPPHSESKNRKKSPPQLQISRDIMLISILVYDKRIEAFAFSKSIYANFHLILLKVPNIFIEVHHLIRPFSVIVQL